MSAETGRRAPGTSGVVSQAGSAALEALGDRTVLEWLEVLPLGAIVLDTNGVIVYSNRPALESTEFEEPAELVGRHLKEISDSDDPPEEQARTWQSLLDGNKWAGEIWALTSAGRSVPLLVTRCPIIDDHHQVVGVLSVAVTRQGEVDAQRALQKSEQIFRRTVEQSSDAFIAVDSDDRISDWNPAACRMFGWSPDEAIGQELAELILPPSSRAPYRRGFERALSGESSRFVDSPFDMMALDRYGRMFPVEVCVVKVDLGPHSQFQAFVRDISQRKATEARLTERALTDQLTNLPNRALLRDRLARAVARLGRSPSTLAIMFLDVDRFKLVNDGLGHDAGDDLLIELGTRIQRSVRLNDTVARYGGDEFIIVAEDVSSAREPLVIAERVLQAVSAPVTIGERELTPSVSIGIAITSDKLARPDDLIRDADVAMYRAKDRGGNCAVVFDDLMGRRALGRFRLEADLRHAVEHGELRVHYQPIVSLSGEIAALEALVRWQHPDRGLLLPAEFIPLAEETALVIPLGLWVLEEAVRHVADWRSRLTPTLELSVNVSTRQLADPTFPDRVADILDRQRFEPAMLCLEITESGILDEQGSAATTLEELRRLGVKVGVDDFGTGYSSLGYLRRIPVQVLKLDRVFVDGLASVPEDMVIAKSVITLARELGITPIAEGVETCEQRDILRGLGCEMAQGFLWAAAGPAAEVEGWLDATPARLSASPD